MEMKDGNPLVHGVGSWLHNIASHKLAQPGALRTSIHEFKFKRGSYSTKIGRRRDGEVRETRHIGTWKWVRVNYTIYILYKPGREPRQTGALTQI